MSSDHEDPTEEVHPEDEVPRKGLRKRLTKLLNGRELTADTREVLGGMLEMSDRAKNEAVRLVAREVRNYLDELKIKEDLLELATSHSLEVKLSLHLKPLAEAERARDRRASERSAVPAKAVGDKERKAAAAPVADDDPEA